MRDLVAVPLFLPALAAWAVVGALAARRIGRRLGIHPVHAFGLVVSLGIVLSATLTPQGAALVRGATGPATCDLSRLGFASIHDYLVLGDIQGNVLMFIPLGVALALLPASRNRAALVLAGALVPVCIETTQLMLGFLDRACQSGDVVDNLLGLGIGLALGAVVGVVRGRI